MWITYAYIHIYKKRRVWIEGKYEYLAVKNKYTLYIYLCNSRFGYRAVVKSFFIPI